MNKRLTLLLSLVLLSTPLFAQSTSLTVFVTSAQNSGGDRFGDTGNITSEFDNGSGFGVSVDRKFGRRLSGELALFSISSEGSLRENGVGALSLGDIDMMPVTAMLRVHLRPDSPLDVSIGAGAAYVQIDDLDSPDLRAEGLAPVTIDNETGFVVGAALTWSFSQRWGATLDARYLPLTLHGNANGERASAAIDPLLISAGVRVRF